MGGTCGLALPCVLPATPPSLSTGSVLSAGRSAPKIAHANAYVKEDIKMASAKRREVEKTRMVEETYTVVDGVVLELTQDEAYMLTALLGFKTGGANQHIMSVYRALKSQFNVYGPAIEKFNAKMSGYVTVEV